jgi:hypothetical protein
VSWSTDAEGNATHVCDRCGAHPSEANPFGFWVVVLFPGENAKHFCDRCAEALRVLLDGAMSS